jgi:hypothetical protein
MAEPKVKEPIAVDSKTLSQCQCGATVFEGEFAQGEIVNKKFVPRMLIYRCVNCNKIQTIDEMLERVIPYVM